MNNKDCAFTGDREGMLVGYLYDELAPRDRATFESHLEGCAACFHEVAELRAARLPLTEWQPPDLVSVLGARSEDFGRSRSWWQDAPPWTQAAAALLFVGVAVGAANLDIKYDAGGVTVRTGWLAPKNTAAVTPPSIDQTAPWRADLTALERRLRTELGAATDAATRPVPARDQSADAAVRQVRALLAESERKQQRELALRVAEVLRDVQQQRQADLSKIDRNLGIIQNSTGVEVMRQRQLINSLAVRVSQRQ